jgi:hypothetical protein
MQATELTGKKAKDQYGVTVILQEITGNTVRTDKGLYHTTKLFIAGKTIQTLLNK